MARAHCGVRAASGMPLVGIRLSGTLFCRGGGVRWSHLGRDNGSGVNARRGWLLDRSGRCGLGGGCRWLLGSIPGLLLGFAPGFQAAFSLGRGHDVAHDGHREQAIQHKRHDAAQDRTHGVGGFGNGHHQGDIKPGNQDQVHGAKHRAEGGMHTGKRRESGLMSVNVSPSKAQCGAGLRCQRLPPRQQWMQARW